MEIKSSGEGQYWGYYERIGRDKNKKYGCIFCEYKLPSYSGITSHLERTHRREINKIEEEEREKIENKKREEELIKEQLEEQEREEIARKIREKELAKQRRIEFLRDLELEEKRRILEEKRQEEQKKQRRKERIQRIEIWNMIQEADEKKRATNNLIKFWFLDKFINSEKSWEELFFLYTLGKQTILKE